MLHAHAINFTLEKKINRSMNVSCDTYFCKTAMKVSYEG